ncbi:hypothetical protein POJ06DRAFT_84417 [Lipomyces tetrasporus]|uniref:DNA replication complex GINS protein SLD5 n=1 Tax=Lipomyces tetrasporus TaxID=54092 RepID=A0AAD7QT99_9ASCO|nr:uncharacterized protein POJ06DRAFT_84417 [Lipomyces tetrasporus]KAJ8100936.1 hypothetical protein POJ06DRAFT_84417 [Lipomyces tetrasporus]
MTDERDLEIDDLINNLDNDYYTAHPTTDSAHVKDQKSRDLNRLVRLWIAERTCPDILPYAHDLLDTIVDRIREQVEFIEVNTVSGDASGSAKLNLLLVETELERVKFLVRGYLRARIHKIEKYYMHVVSNAGVQARLSQSELRYTKRRANQLKRYYDLRFLSSLPPSLQRLDDTAGGLQMVDAPDLDEAVFIRVLHDVPGEIDLGNGDKIELRKGNIYVLSYMVVRRHIADGDVQLV